MNGGGGLNQSMTVVVCGNGRCAISWLCCGRGGIAKVDCGTRCCCITLLDIAVGGVGFIRGVDIVATGMSGVATRGVAVEPLLTESGGVGMWFEGERIGGDTVGSVPGGVESSMRRFSFD